MATIWFRRWSIFTPTVLATDGVLVKKPDIVCLGEAMVELSLTGALPGPGQLSFAGDVYNTAVYIKRCAPELRVAFATKVGRDRFSQAFLQEMEEEGLDTSLVAISEDRVPGLYAISTDAAGERSFTYWRDRSAARTVFDAPGLGLEDLAGPCLYFSAISLAILPEARRAALLDWLPAYRWGGGCVAFDSNYRPALWQDAETARRTIETAWRETDVALPSADDEAALFGDADADAIVARMQGYGVRRGALKSGPRGPVALNGTAVGPFEEAVLVVDSTAAGDSFNGAYLAALLQGRSQAEAMQAGHTLASEVIGVRGAILPRAGMAGR